MQRQAGRNTGDVSEPAGHDATCPGVNTPGYDPEQVDPEQVVPEEKGHCGCQQ